MATKVAGILGKKVGMTQLFDSKGDVRPVTVLQAGPCVVTQHKTAVKDGYECGADRTGGVCERVAADEACEGTSGEEQSAAGEVHARGSA